MTTQIYALVVGAALLVGVLALGFMALLLYQARGQMRLQQRLQGAGVGLRDEVEESAGGAPLLAQLVRRGRDLERLVDTEGESARLLVQAGWRSTPARALWYAFQAACPLLGVLVVAALWTFKGEQTRTIFIVLYALMAVILSVLIPRYVLRGAAEGRRERIKQEVPLFAHLLVLLFEAGLSTRQAFASLVREGGGVLPELGREFELVLRQLEAGADTGDALRGLAEGLDVADLTGVLAVLRQVDRYGGEIREPLLDMLKLLEERRALDMRERVNRMSGRMTVVMVMFFFPALLIFVAGPAFVSILRVLGQAAGR
ncbi:MAG: type II secretion system F family protein [Gammaproteobacteria bacterium]|nr:type II secretion system F family protein [Gammaproteobacteria bacterium]